MNSLYTIHVHVAVYLHMCVVHVALEMTGESKAGVTTIQEEQPDYDPPVSQNSSVSRTMFYCKICVHCGTSL